MIVLTDAQFNAWLAAFLFPLARILGLITAAPLFDNAALNMRIRLALGVAIALALAPALPEQTFVAPASWTGLLVLVQQTLIGIALGFTMRLVFAAVDVAGDLIGLQMGLSFAVFYDPQNASESPIIAELLGLLGMLVFLAMDGHLMVIALLAQSFTALPIGPESYAAAGWSFVAHWGAILFKAGVLLSLPLIAAMLVTNIALGILTKAAPQLNLFAVGFPITLAGGLAVLALTMPYFVPAMEGLAGQGFEAMNALMATKP